LNKEGQGRPEGAPKKEDRALQKEQRRGQKNASEAGEDYSAMLSSIRADQAVETFVADLRKNKEQLFSLIKKIRCGKIRPIETSDDTRDKLEVKLNDAQDNLALSFYMDYSLRVALNPDIENPHHLISANPSDWPDEDSSEPLTYAERTEILVDWATRRIASKWLATHPESEAAKTFVDWGAYAFYQFHPELLQEMWPSIRDLSMRSMKKK
jgi:hypothetical protein